jgi:hypothetical protein
VKQNEIVVYGQVTTLFEKIRECLGKVYQTLSLIWPKNFISLLGLATLISSFALMLCSTINAGVFPGDNGRLLCFCKLMVNVNVNHKPTRRGCKLLLRCFESNEFSRSSL